MCEYISLIATTDGPLHFYGAPGMNSHVNARAGWGIVGGAELEWTGETHSCLTVRHEDPEVARTIRGMVIDRYATRTDLIATISELRGLNGEVVKIPHTPDDVKAWGSDPKFSVYLRGYTHALPASLTSIGGYVYLRGYTHALPASLTSIGGYVDLDDGSLTLEQYRIKFPVKTATPTKKKISKKSKSKKSKKAK